MGGGVSSRPPEIRGKPGLKTPRDNSRGRASPFTCASRVTHWLVTPPNGELARRPPFSLQLQHFHTTVTLP